MSKSVLITGGAGYIGSHIVKKFKDRGYTTIVIDDLSTGVQKYSKFADVFFQADYADPRVLDEVFTKYNVDGVVHMAASLSVGESVQKPLQYLGNNSIKTYELLKKLVQYNIKKIIFSSTAAVYGNPASADPIDETVIPQPINPYGTSKLISEMMIQELAKVYNFKFGILRYFNVGGAGYNQEIGQVTQNATHLIKVICEHLVGKRDKVQIYGDDYPTTDGTCIRDYIHVMDLAQAHIDVYNYLSKEESTSEIFNCGYGQGYSVKQVIASAEKVSKLKIKVQMAPRRAGDSVSVVADASKIQAKTGWKPEYDSLDKIIKSAFEWEKSLDVFR